MWRTDYALVEGSSLAPVTAQGVKSSTLVSHETDSQRIFSLEGLKRKTFKMTKFRGSLELLRY